MQNAVGEREFDVSGLHALILPSARIADYSFRFGIMRAMKKPVKNVWFGRLISALVIVALLAILARTVYYTLHWRDLVSAAQSASWLEWTGVALFVVWLVWSIKRKEKFD